MRDGLGLVSAVALGVTAREGETLLAGGSSSRTEERELCLLDLFLFLLFLLRQEVDTELAFPSVSPSGASLRGMMLGVLSIKFCWTTVSIILDIWASFDSNLDSILESKWASNLWSMRSEISSLRRSAPGSSPL